MVYYIVGSLLLFTTITDIFWRRIPNILILIYFGAGIFILHLDFLIRFIISLFIFSAFYRIRFFGAGDIKLFSLIIGFLGIYDGINMSIEKYSEYKLRDKHMIPVAPCFLAGFILWRCFC